MIRRDKHLYYIGLDVAETMGVAIVDDQSDTHVVTSYKATPIRQLEYIIGGLLRQFNSDDEPYFVIERMHHQRNMRTVQSLAQRIGYLKYSLLAFGFACIEVGTSEARSLLGAKNKVDTLDYFVPFYWGFNLTSDHTDALAVALWAKHYEKKDVPKEMIIYDYGQERKESAFG